VQHILAYVACYAQYFLSPARLKIAETSSLAMVSMLTLAS
jgi:hypothetical protein